MFNYNYPPGPNPGYSGFPFPPPFPINYPQNFLPPQNFIPTLNPSSFQENFQKPSINLLTRKRDTEFINNFIDNEGNPCQLKNTEKELPKISEINDAVRIIYTLNQSIKSICTEMKYKNLPDNEWQTKMEIAKNLKNQVETLSIMFEDEKFMETMKSKLSKRKKKRLREKRKRDALRNEIKERRERLNVEIDNWIKKKQNLIEREKQEEILRKDADIVLSDVRGKRSDAKKFSSLLKEMQNFRNVKVKIARARGENFPQAADQAFNNIIGKLVEHWTALDREYSLEEQGLKLMIQTDNERKEETKKMHAFNNWEQIIFGQRLPKNAFLQNNLLNFVTIRTMWDKFYDTNGKPIPMGWVVPVPPSSAAWQTLLKKP